MFSDSITIYYYVLPDQTIKKRFQKCQKAFKNTFLIMASDILGK